MQRIGETLLSSYQCFMVLLNWMKGSQASFAVGRRGRESLKLCFLFPLKCLNSIKKQAGCRESNFYCFTCFYTAIFSFFLTRFYIFERINSESQCKSYIYMSSEAHNCGFFSDAFFITIRILRMLSSLSFWWNFKSGFQRPS